MKELQKQHDLIKKFLLLRNNLENSLDELKLKLNKAVLELKDKIRNTRSSKNISIQKINFYISAFRPEFSRDNLNEMVSEIFEFMVNRFDYLQCSNHYKENEVLIKDYIRLCIENHLELKSKRYSIRQEIKNYREENKGTINFNAAETAFVEMRRTLRKPIDAQYLSDLEVARNVANDVMKDLINPESEDYSKETVQIIEKPKTTPKKRVKTHNMSESEIIKMLFGNSEIKNMLDNL